MPQAITITGNQSIREGETLTLTLSVRFSDGTVQTPSSGVTWTSETPVLASVNAAGVVTGHSAGEARIRATYQALSAATAVSVAPGKREFTGRVHESAPTQHIGIPSAVITGTDSAGNSDSARANGEGYFFLRLVPGPVQLNVSAPNYHDKGFLVEAPSDGTIVSLALVPVLEEVRLAFDYVYPPPPVVLVERRFTVAIHNPGVFRALYTRSWMPASAHWYSCLEVRDAENRVLAATSGSYDNAAGEIRLNVTGGELLEVKFSVCGYSGSPGLSIHGWAGEIRHPR